MSENVQWYRRCLRSPTIYPFTYFKTEQNPTNYVINTETRNYSENSSDTTKVIPQLHKSDTANDFLVDKELLHRINRMIASSQLQSQSVINNDLQRNILKLIGNNRYFYANLNNLMRTSYNPKLNPMLSYMYVMNIPVFVIPTPIAVYSSNIIDNNIESGNINTIYQTRQQQPSLPSFPSFSLPSFQDFQFQLPFSFANIFPILIKDPWVVFTQGGGLNNLIDYGQSADVCRRNQKSVGDDDETREKTSISYVIQETNSRNDDDSYHTKDNINFRKSRAQKKLSKIPERETRKRNKLKISHVTEPIISAKANKILSVPQTFATKKIKTAGLRLPFNNEISWLKDMKPYPGFFINKLRVRKGGVAIAAPGGIATAGSGSTALVGGPAGLAIAPGTLAVGGYQSRVVSSLGHFGSILSKLHSNDTFAESFPPVREENVNGTNPIIYQHSDQEN